MGLRRRTRGGVAVRQSEVQATDPALLGWSLRIGGSALHPEHLRQCGHDWSDARWQPGKGISVQSPCTSRLQCSASMTSLTPLAARALLICPQRLRTDQPLWEVPGQHPAGRTTPELAGLLLALHSSAARFARPQSAGSDGTLVQACVRSRHQGIQSSTGTRAPALPLALYCNSATLKRWGLCPGDAGHAQAAVPGGHDDPDAGGFAWRLPGCCLSLPQPAAPPLQGPAQFCGL